MKKKAKRKRVEVAAERAIGHSFADPHYMNHKRLDAFLAGARWAFRQSVATVNAIDANELKNRASFDVRASVREAIRRRARD